ncbi:cysteine proteinase [Rozella allomycis CSF55]|uniref:Ubiquitin carboxyl-terminal hydrolase n=1 Tax=Rozella allomycis (strain CSF55) TaxID=988480 RepID=A0A4P9YQ00_ROZAC|nr:cysteine proteinase [Rozella allomycis CSF55]
MNNNEIYNIIENTRDLKLPKINVEKVLKAEKDKRDLLHRGSVGIKNLGATCFMNSIFQSLFHIPLIQELFCKLERSKRAVVEPDERIFDYLGVILGEQEDVPEFIEKFISCILNEFEGTAYRDEIQNLFKGAYLFRNTCFKCNFVSSSELGFLVYNSQKNLEDALRESLKEEYLTGENSRYKCPNCNQNRECIRNTELKRLPPVLMIQLLRSQFDQASMKLKKKKNILNFPNDLTLNGVDYQLCSVLIHIGKSVNRGHYFSYTFDFDSNHFKRFDDHKVFDTESENVKFKNAAKDAYMLIYLEKNSITKRSKNPPMDIIDQVDQDNIRLLQEQAVKVESFSEFLNLMQSWKVTEFILKDCTFTDKSSLQNFINSFVKFNTSVETGGNEILCIHDQLDVNKSKNIIAVPHCLVPLLLQSGYTPATFTADDICQKCKVLSDQKLNDQRRLKFRELNRSEKRDVIIEKQWLNKWPNPSIALRCPHGLLNPRKEGWLNISREAFDFLMSFCDNSDKVCFYNDSAKCKECNPRVRLDKNTLNVFRILNDVNSPQLDSLATYILLPAQVLEDIQNYIKKILINFPFAYTYEGLLCEHNLLPFDLNDQYDWTCTHKFHVVEDYVVQKLRLEIANIISLQYENGKVIPSIGICNPCRLKRYSCFTNEFVIVQKRKSIGTKRRKNDASNKLRLQMSHFNTIKELKMEVMEQWNVPCFYQTLYNEGVELPDDDSLTLQQAGIIPNSVLTLSIFEESSEFDYIV